MKWLAIFLALSVLLGPLSAWSEQLVSSGSVVLSPSEYDAIEAALAEANRQLEASSKTIAKQSTLLEQAAQNLTASSETIRRQETSLKRLSIFCGLLGGALVVDGIAEIIEALK